MHFHFPVMRHINIILIFPQNIHVVSFSKPGFIELPPIAFNVGTEIHLSFSTKNESGIILFGTNGAPVPPRRKRRQSGQVYNYN